MTKQITYLFLISFFTVNCTFFTNYGRDYKRAQNKYLDKNYDQSIDFCINSLNRNPHFKKSKMMYEKLVPLAIEYHHSNINLYSNDSNNQKNLVKSFEKLFSLIDKLEKASISDSYKSHLREDYSKEYNKALESIANFHYKKGIELMSYDEKGSYKSAYNEFIMSNYYKKNYKDSKKHIEKCKKNSIFHITIMDFDNNTKNKYDVLGNSISNKLISNLQTIQSFNEIVDIVDRKNINILIEQLKISDSGLIENSQIEIGEIKEVDHIIRGEINEVIVNEPKHTYERVRINQSDGSFGGYKKKHRIEAYVLIEVYLEIIDVETSEIINSKTFSAENSYLDKWTTGIPNTNSVSSLLLDVALTAILNKGSGKNREQISSEEMLNDATNKINNKIKTHLTEFYK